MGPKLDVFLTGRLATLSSNVGRAPGGPTKEPDFVDIFVALLLIAALVVWALLEVFAPRHLGP